MYTVDKYLEDTRILIKSLVIKINEVALQINYNLYMQTGIKISSDPHEWKYYLNLAGEKHYTNNDIYVYVIETETKQLMTKELMSIYTNTRNDLLTRSKQYEELLLTYPDDRAYIDGMLLPVDIDTAINAPNGELLNYDSRYVGHQEIGIIRELNDHISSFLARWHLKEYYITDNLYLASMIATLTMSCYNFILNARLNRVYTNEAHDFHIEHFFRSHMDLWDSLTVLNKRSIIWLYKNIRYLIKHVGKEIVLEKIIDNIFTSNKLGIGTYMLETTDAEIITANIDDPTKSYFKLGTPVFKSIPLNTSYSGSETQLTIDDIVRNEIAYNKSIDTDVFADHATFFSRVVERDLKNKVITKQPTKIFDIGINKLFDMHNINIIQMMIDYWVYYSHTYDPVELTFFTDPNSQKSYLLTMKQGMYYLFKLISKVLNIDNLTLDQYNYKEIINTEITKEEMIANLYSADNMDSLVDIIYDKLPKSYLGIQDRETFQAFVDDLISLFTSVWILESNVNNFTISANIKHIVNRIFTHGSVDIRYNESIMSIDDILTAEGIVIELNDTYDYNVAIKELLDVFTGQPFHKYSNIDGFVDSCIDIFNKLTSYTTQIIKSVDDTEHTSISYTGIKVNNADFGLITIRDAEITAPLELDHVPLNTVADDLSDNGSSYNAMNNPEVVYKPPLIFGIAYSEYQQPELVGGTMEPVISVEIY